MASTIQFSSSITLEGDKDDYGGLHTANTLL